MDSGAQWATVLRVTKSRTRLKWLSKRRGHIVQWWDSKLNSVWLLHPAPYPFTSLHPQKQVALSDSWGEDAAASADDTQDCSQLVFPWLCLGKPNCCNCVIKLSLYPRKWARATSCLFLWLSQIIKWAAASKYVCSRLIQWLRVLAYSWLPTHSPGLQESSNGTLKVNLSWQFK